jgi:phosphonate transport system ATP-binding protein
MRLIVELAHERGTPALVNIHDVGLAQSFADRIIGLADGKIVFDGTAGEITAQVLTDIYGEEDWSTTIQKTGEHPNATKKTTASQLGKNIEDEASAG